jgi:hypothetical protein
MLKRTFRIYALSLVGGALLLGGASVAATAMTLPESLAGGDTEQSTTAIFTGGAGAAKIEQIWWRGGGWGWHHGWGWHRGGGWRGGGWCYWHPYACRGW